MILYAASSYVQPFLIGIAFSRFIAKGNIMGLNLLGLVFVGLAVVGWGAQYLQLANTGYIGHRVLYALRTQMFDHLQTLSLRFYDNNEVGRIMSRLTSDVVVLQDLLTTGILTVLADIVGLAFIVLFLFLQDVELALLTLSRRAGPRRRDGHLAAAGAPGLPRVRQAIAVVNADLQENVSGVRVVQALSREGENVRRFDSINASNLNANIEAGRLQAMVMPLVEILVAAATATGHRRRRAAHPRRLARPGRRRGFILSFTLYIQRFFDPVRDLVLQYTQLQRAMAGGQRIFEVLDTKPDIVDADGALDPDDMRGQVAFEHVSFSYGPDVEVLHDIDLRSASRARPSPSSGRRAPARPRSPPSSAASTT